MASAIELSSDYEIPVRFSLIDRQDTKIRAAEARDKLREITGSGDRMSSFVLGASAIREEIAISLKGLDFGIDFQPTEIVIYDFPTTPEEFESF